MRRPPSRGASHPAQQDPAQQDGRVSAAGRIDRDDWVTQAAELTHDRQATSVDLPSIPKAPTVETGATNPAAGTGTVDDSDAAGWRTAEVDDLKVISGIGPKLEALLHEIGVRTYEQIAAFPADYIDQLDEFLSFPGRIERDGWTAQAAELARTRPAKTSSLPPIPDETPDNATA